MANVPGFFDYVQQAEEAENQEELAHNWRAQRKRLRDATNPFDVPDIVFIQNFRLNKALALSLIQRLEQSFPQNRAFSLSPSLRVLISLKFLACGSYQRGSIEHHNLLNISQQSVSKSLKLFLNAMDATVVREEIKFPRTEAEIQAVKAGFYEKFQFPDCIGAVDGTIIGIIRPHENEEQYYSHKGLHAINAQICDSNLRIMGVNPRHGGATNDSYIWRFSVINEHMRVAYLNGRRYTWLIGDSGYPLQPWLLVPILNVDPNSPQGRFTHAHIRARNCVERVIGVLKMKWRCLTKHRILHYTPDKARQIIRTCAALHNIAMNMPDYAEEAEHFEDIEHGPEQLVDPANVIADEAAEGLVVRTAVVTAHFT